MTKPKNKDKISFAEIYLQKISYAHAKTLLKDFASEDDINSQDKQGEENFVKSCVSLYKSIKEAKNNINDFNPQPPNEGFKKLLKTKYILDCLDPQDKVKACEYATQAESSLDKQTKRDIKDFRQDLLSKKTISKLLETKDKSLALKCLVKQRDVLSLFSNKATKHQEKLEKENKKIEQDARKAEKPLEQSFFGKIDKTKYSKKFANFIMDNASLHILQERDYVYYGQAKDFDLTPQEEFEKAKKIEKKRVINIKKRVFNKLKTIDDQELKKQTQEFFNNPKDVKKLSSYCASIEMFHEEELNPLSNHMRFYSHNVKEIQGLKGHKKVIFSLRDETKKAIEKTRPVDVKNILLKNTKKTNFSDEFKKGLFVDLSKLNR